MSGACKFLLEPPNIFISALPRHGAGMVRTWTGVHKSRIHRPLIAGAELVGTTMPAF